MLEHLYRGLTHLAGPAVAHLLEKRAARGKEDPARRGERMGMASRARPPGCLIWLHAASVGESLAILPLIDRLLALNPRAHALVTTGTVTSAALLEQRLPPRAFHQYVPVDLPTPVRRFLAHWRPDMALWVESEFWPNLLAEVRRRGIPAALVNARLSEKSFRNWRRVPGTIARMLSVFRIALAQTEAGAERLRALGVREARAVGNLKFSADPLPADTAELTRWRAAVGARPVWAFASTHPGEEEIAADAHARVAREVPGLLTLLAPRHPARGDAVAALLAERGLTVRRRSRGELPDSGTDVFLVDTMGELGLVFRTAPVAAIGGSFVDVGGHNPVEPALLGAAVLYGPRMDNFEEIAAGMEAAGGAVRVPDAVALATTVRLLLTDGEGRALIAGAALSVAERNRQAVDRVVAALEPLLACACIGGEGR